MIKRLIIAGVATFIFSAAAYAGECVGHMQEIDAALESAQLSDIDRASVLEFRATGQALHEAGNHADSVATLGQAKTLLGL